MVVVTWAATSPESGRFDPLVSRSDVESLDERFAALKARGEGYLEVRRVNDYPGLAMGFRGSVAVIEAFVSQERMAILVGDGSCPGELVKVPTMDEETSYSGQAGIDVERAWGLVREFAKGRDLSELGEWFEL